MTTFPMLDNSSVPSTPPNRLSQSVLFGLVSYVSTSVIVVLAVSLGYEFFKPSSQTFVNQDIISCFANWDGQWYRAILERGYSYDPDSPSDVAFFPAYPLLGRTLSKVTGLSSNESLLLAAHLSLAGAFILMAAYSAERLGERANAICPWVLLSMGLLPMGFFFRMAYSESLFLFVAILSLYGMERRWPLWIISLIVGFATATRPVGVALLPPLILQIWFCSASWKSALPRLVLFGATGCWGIAAFMLYQWVSFGEPLGFAITQDHWRVRLTASSVEHLTSLVTLEPLWSAFVPSSPCFWANHSPSANPFLSVELAQPMFFATTAILIILGGIKGWLNRNELVFSEFLLLIPYVTRSHEMCSASMGRFAAVVFPAYLVLGHLFGRMPVPAVAVILAISTFFMAVYSALFASGHRIF